MEVIWPQVFKLKVWIKFKMHINLMHHHKVYQDNPMINSNLNINQTLLILKQICLSLINLIEYCDAKMQKTMKAIQEKGIQDIGLMTKTNPSIYHIFHMDQKIMIFLPSRILLVRQFPENNDMDTSQQPLADQLIHKQIKKLFSHLLHSTKIWV